MTSALGIYRRGAVVLLKQGSGTGIDALNEPSGKFSGAVDPWTPNVDFADAAYNILARPVTVVTTSSTAVFPVAVFSSIESGPGEADWLWPVRRTETLDLESPVLPGRVTSMVEVSDVTQAARPLAKAEVAKDRMERNKRAIELLNSWMQGDVNEQRRSWERLRKALDENRLSGRKLFQDE